MSQVFPLSRTAVQLELRCRGIECGLATGSFWNSPRGIMLVTNWHVFSGRDCFTGQARHPQGAIPDEVIIRLSDLHVQLAGTAAQNRPLSLPLYNDDQTLWYQHPHGQLIDLAYLPVVTDLTLLQDAIIPPPNSNEAMAVGPGLSVFILGFPKGIAKQGALPIWKQGSIASEPDIPYDGLPLFVVDSATRDGMSGSPVFLFSPNYQLVKQNNSIHGTYSNRPHRIVGVYSGRYGAEDELAAQLGRVWNTSSVQEMLNANVLGTYVLA